MLPRESTLAGTTPAILCCGVGWQITSEDEAEANDFRMLQLSAVSADVARARATIGASGRSLPPVKVPQVPCP